MGLFTYYLGYRYAKKKAERRRQQEEWEEEDICDECGYTFRQHSDEGECPTYS